MSDMENIKSDGALTAAPGGADKAECRRICVLSVGFDPLTPGEAAQSVFLAASRKKGDCGGERLPFTVVTPNPISVMKATN